MRLRVLSQTVAALCLLSPLIVWSETLVTLDVGFGVRYVPPSRISVPAGERVTVVAPRDAGEQWIRDGRPLEGKTPNVLVIESAKPADAGSYVFTFLGPGIPERGSQILELSVGPAQRFLNLSTRGFVGSGMQTLIAGFVVGGKNQKTILIRAVGPGLAQFGVTGLLQNPKFTVFDSAGHEYLSAFTYPRPTGEPDVGTHIRNASALVGAFRLIDGGADAVAIRPFDPGIYTVHVTGADGGSGIALIELYEVPE